MIHVVNSKNRHLYREQLEEHFRIRYEIYVKQRKWMALDRPDGREVDQFDNDDATYLLMLENKRVVGGTRFVPTLKPHLTSEVFPFLPNIKGVQRGHNIVEWTRIFLIQEKRGAEYLKRICTGMLEYYLDEGYDAITVVMETWWIPRLLALRWDIEPLGIPQMYDGMEIVSALININMDNYLSLKEEQRIYSQLLVYNEGALRL